MGKIQYECTVLIDASNCQTVFASSPEEAADLAQDAAIEDGAGSLCHYCARHTDTGDVYGVVVYSGNNEVLNTCYQASREKVLQDKIDSLQQRLNAVEEENDRLRSALVDISEIEDELTGGDWDEIEEARSIARIALEKRP